MRFFLCVFTATLLAQQPQYNPQGQLRRPTDYRDWTFLSSGLGMTYGPAAAMSKDPRFDTVFVSPTAWKSFRQTGRWPDKTIFLLEIRASSSQGSINQAGYFPSEVVAMEAAVKDVQRFEGGWAYFDFPRAADGQFAATAPLLGRKASCYACHQTNGAVENTFVQFYPTALEVAKRQGTLKLKDTAHSPR